MAHIHMSNSDSSELAADAGMNLSHDGLLELLALHKGPGHGFFRPSMQYQNGNHINHPDR